MSIFHSKTRSLRKFQHDQNGATLVELSVVLPIFLLIFLGLIDFARLAFHYVTAEKAMHVAARVAAVRPAVCPNVPQIHERGPVAGGTVPPKYGSMCNSAANVCANLGEISCSGSAGNATSAEIWALLSGALPNDAVPGNLRFAYTFDSNLGFLGGPYVPIVTVELQNLTFQFISPLSALIGMSAGTAPAGLGADILFPKLSVSLPAEDLSLGNAG